MSKMRFKEWAILAKHGRFTEPFDMKSINRPRKVGEKVAPKDLNSLTLGQLFQLQDIKDTEGLFYTPPLVLFGMEREEVNKADAVEIVKLAAWTAREVERISKLFAACNKEPSIQEKRAGIDRLQFGHFGLIDWYARRMGYLNHDDVLKVSWAEVFTCLQMDSEQAKFEQRLNKVYRDEQKHRK